MLDYERFALILDSASAEPGRAALRLLELGIDVVYANDLDEAELLRAKGVTWRLWEPSTRVAPYQP
jgi:hypothetical protein